MRLPEEKLQRKMIILAQGSAACLYYSGFYCWDYLIYSETCYNPSLTTIIHLAGLSPASNLPYHHIYLIIVLCNKLWENVGRKKSESKLPSFTKATYIQQRLTYIFILFLQQS